jgi:ribosomal protein S18 acetylase RimI-like enzyme
MMSTAYIRPRADSDIPTLVELTIETFRPFYEDYVHVMLGDDLFRHQHGRWEQDYRDEVPALHDPPAGRQVAVAEIAGILVGYVAWRIERPAHGEIHLLAVAATDRRQHLGRELCLHAIQTMKTAGVEAVEIGTGGDPFHAPARSLYENLGFTRIPTTAYLKLI